MNPTLAEKRYLVTGGSSGIGLETARLLRAAGASVAILGRNRESLQAAAAAIGARPIVADVGKPDDVDAGVAAAAAALGGLDGLINNAGTAGRGRVEDLCAETFAALLRTNLIGPALMMKAVLPYLEAAGGGDVVNVGSSASLHGYPGGSMYAASKFGLRALSECWRAELRPRNIRVVQVNPSEVQTAFGGRADSDRKPNKLFALDIATAIVGALSIHPRGFVPEISIWATNPWDRVS